MYKKQKYIKILSVANQIGIKARRGALFLWQRVYWEILNLRYKYDSSKNCNFVIHFLFEVDMYKYLLSFASIIMFGQLYAQQITVLGGGRPAYSYTPEASTGLTGGVFVIYSLDNATIEFSSIARFHIRACNESLHQKLCVPLNFQFLHFGSQ